MKARMSQKLRAALAKPSSAIELRKAIAERSNTISLNGKIYRLTRRPQQVSLVTTPHTQGSASS